MDATASLFFSEENRKKGSGESSKGLRFKPKKSLYIKFYRSRVRALLGARFINVRALLGARLNITCGLYLELALQKDPAVRTPSGNFCPHPDQLRAGLLV